MYMTDDLVFLQFVFFLGGKSDGSLPRNRNRLTILRLALASSIEVKIKSGLTI